MQQIYWRTPTPKCDFNKVAKQIKVLLPLIELDERMVFHILTPYNNTL